MTWPFASATALAPMEGVTHPLFRGLIARRGGVGLLCTEFVRISRAPISGKALRRAVVKADGVPLSVQVMGNEADKMAEAAQLVAEAGADVVDINMGCPTPRVVRKGVGAAMLKNPDLLFEVLSAMRQAVPGLLSAKIRAGFDDAANVVGIAKLVQQAGADFIAVHPRRRMDFYEGVADWRIISVLKSELSIPVVGNGDVWYAADALRMQEQTGCDAVMMGRPAMRNPWIFEQVADLRRGRPPRRPAGADVVAWIDEVARLYEPEFGRGALGKLKELVRWLGRAVADEGHYRKAALRASTTDELVQVSHQHLCSMPSSRIDLAAQPTLGFERSGGAGRTTITATHA